jgi:hypothetical protein
VLVVVLVELMLALAVEWVRLAVLVAVDKVAVTRVFIMQVLRVQETPVLVEVGVMELLTHLLTEVVLVVQGLSLSAIQVLFQT